MRLTKAEAKMIRADRIRRGDCLLCGQKRDDPSFKTCGACRERTRKRAEGYRDRVIAARVAKKKLRLCTQNGCESEAARGLTVCRYHAELRAERGKRRRERLREEGRCYGCGAPPVPGRKACANCQEKNRARVRRYVDGKTGAIRLPMAQEVKR